MFRAQDRAQMTATPPEGTSEYSRGGRASGAGDTTLAGAIPALVVGGSLLGAVLLFVAEFTTLFEITTATRRLPLKSVGTGSHHSYALIPVALLVAFLAYGLWRSRARPALYAIGVLGIVTLLIALIGDLPDAQASGVYGSPARGLMTASSSPQAGLYMETLGAVVLIVCAGTGLLLGGPAGRPARAPHAAPGAPSAP
jgi:hypothetical protein